MLRFPEKLYKEEKGQATVLFVLMLSVLMGGAALAVDMGKMYLTKAQLQNAADNAALSAAMKLPDAEESIEEAYLYASLNDVDRIHTEI